MVSVVLYNPQIPPNTGNIMRLCTNTGFELHIIEPAGFPLNDKSLRRAKLDYFTDTLPILHKNTADFFKSIDQSQVFVVSKFGKNIYTEVNYNENVLLLFGTETKGLPKKILNKFKNRSLKIPMTNNSRSINLSNSVSIVVYEVWRQLKFSGAKV